jgi:hypothetical protein
MCFVSVFSAALYWWFAACTHWSVTVLFFQISVFIARHSTAQHGTAQHLAAIIGACHASCRGYLHFHRKISWVCVAIQRACIATVKTGLVRGVIVSSALLNLGDSPSLRAALFAWPCVKCAGAAAAAGTFAPLRIAGQSASSRHSRCCRCHYVQLSLGLSGHDGVMC